jgi:hypothetical protein
VAQSATFARPRRVCREVVVRHELFYTPRSPTPRSALGTGYLTYRELLTIDAICQWCVAGAVVMAALAARSVTRFLRAGVR